MEEHLSHLGQDSLVLEIQITVLHGSNLWLIVGQFTFGGRKVTSNVLPDIVESRCSICQSVD